MDKIIKQIADELEIKETQVKNTINLIDEGNTIPLSFASNKKTY